jgi:hypothetical protein
VLGQQRSGDSSVDIVIMLQTPLPRGRDAKFGRDKRLLPSSLSRPAVGPAQPPIHWIPWSVSSKIKR